MKAVLNRIRISPKKANLVAGTVRGKSVNEALSILKFMPKKGADILYKVVHSAASNAKNNFKQNLDNLVITRILVTKGPTYKRSLPISRGRAHPIRKRTAHITVEVGLPGGSAPEVKKSLHEKNEKVVVKEAVVKKEGKVTAKKTKQETAVSKATHVKARKTTSKTKASK